MSADKEQDSIPKGADRCGVSCAGPAVHASFAPHVTGAWQMHA